MAQAGRDGEPARFSTTLNPVLLTHARILTVDDETGNRIVRISQTAALPARQTGQFEDFGELLPHASPIHGIGKTSTRSI